MFFLNGDIFPSLKIYQKKLRSSPKNIVKHWAGSTPHIINFVNCLVRNQVHTKQHLLDAWSKDRLCEQMCGFANFQKFILRFSFSVLQQEFREFLIESESDKPLKWPPAEAMAFI